jgi:hypothetical protein
MARILENKTTIIERTYFAKQKGVVQFFEIEIQEEGETIYVEKMNNLLYRKSQSPPRLFLRWLFDSQINNPQTTNDVGSNGCKCFEFVRKAWFKIFDFKK